MHEWIYPSFVANDMSLKLDGDFYLGLHKKEMITWEQHKLHAFINRADDRVLNMIYGLMKADVEEHPLTSKQVTDLDNRIASWEEARKII